MGTKLTKDGLVMINFCISLTGLRNAQIPGKTFVGVSVRMFLEEISI